MRPLFVTAALCALCGGLPGQEAFYGTVKVAAYSPTEATADISQKFANEIMSGLRKEKRIKVLEKVEILSVKGNGTVKDAEIDALKSTGAKTLAVVRIESGSNESATFTIMVVQYSGREFVENIAWVGRVVAAGIGRLADGISHTITAFASFLAEIHVILHVMTVPQICEVRLGGSDPLLYGADGAATFDGPLRAGIVTGEVFKAGYKPEAFQFNVPQGFNGPYVRIDKRVELKAVGR